MIIFMKEWIKGMDERLAERRDYWKMVQGDREKLNSRRKTHFGQFD